MVLLRLQEVEYNYNWKKALSISLSCVCRLVFPHAGRNVLGFDPPGAVVGERMLKILFDWIHSDSINLQMHLWGGPNLPVEPSVNKQITILEKDDKGLQPKHHHPVPIVHEAVGT